MKYTLENLLQVAPDGSLEVIPQADDNRTGLIRWAMHRAPEESHVMKTCRLARIKFEDTAIHANSNTETFIVYDVIGCSLIYLLDYDDRKLAVIAFGADVHSAPAGSTSRYGVVYGYEHPEGTPEFAKHAPSELLIEIMQHVRANPFVLVPDGYKIPESEKTATWRTRLDEYREREKRMSGNYLIDALTFAIRRAQLARMKKEKPS